MLHVHHERNQVKIALSLLESKGACVGSLATFRELFGDTSPELTDENALKYADKFDWTWAASNLLTVDNKVEFEKVRAAALAEYEKVCAAALAEYEKLRAAAKAEYEKIRAPALAEYEKLRAAAWAEFAKVRVPALAEYEKLHAAAWAEFAKVRAVTFVRLYVSQFA